MHSAVTRLSQWSGFFSPASDVVRAVWEEVCVEVVRPPGPLSVLEYWVSPQLEGGRLRHQSLRLRLDHGLFWQQSVPQCSLRCRQGNWLLHCSALQWGGDADLEDSRTGWTIFCKLISEVMLGLYYLAINSWLHYAGCVMLSVSGCNVNQHSGRRRSKQFLDLDASVWSLEEHCSYSAAASSSLQTWVRKGEVKADRKHVLRLRTWVECLLFLNLPLSLLCCC